MDLKLVKFAVKAREASKKGLLIAREIGEETREIIFRKLSELGPNTVLEMDFDLIKYMDASCANEVVVKVLRRLGEHPQVFVILSSVKAQPRGNMEFALEVAKRAVIVREDEGWTILGGLMESYKAALNKVMEMGPATARELQNAMGYNTVNESSTKLSYLYQQRLIAREPGGGRRFRYISLLQGEDGKGADPSEE